LDPRQWPLRHTLEVLDTVTAGQVACVAWAVDAVDGAKWLITNVWGRSRVGDGHMSEAQQAR
jgi:hypothetical protein